MVQTTSEAATPCLPNRFLKHLTFQTGNEPIALNFLSMLNIPPITRNLLLINVIYFLLQLVLQGQGIDLNRLLGLHFFLADHFHLYQLVTYMFLHGSFTHLFFNMFSLWMFGGIIERTLGFKRFLTYFFVCGIGAGLCQEVWQLGQYYIEGLHEYTLVNTGQSILPMGQFLDFWTTIGASGACYGVLLAFGMLYPNERIMLLLPPIPLKAKYFVAGYAAIEVFSAYASNDNVAHFAHLGGMLFGWLLLYYWKHQHQAPVQNGWQGWEVPGRQRMTWSQRFRARWQKTFTRTSVQPGNAHRTATRESDYEYNMRQKAEEARMDEILDKIRQSGYDSLTDEEKKELFRISRR